MKKSDSISTEPLSLKVNMMWNSAGALVYHGFTWLLTIAVVRIAGDYQDAGVLALAMAVYNIINPIAIYRMYTYQVSDIKHENSLGEYLAFRVITCCAALTIGLAYSAFTNPISTLLPVALFLLWKTAGLFIEVLHATMQLNARMDYIGKSDALQGSLSFFAFCIGYWLTRSLEIAFIGMIIVTVVVGLAYDLPRAIRFEPIKLGISREKAIHLILYCLPVVIATIACSAAASIPRQYLAMTQGEALLGIYASIAAPAAIIQMGASYIYNPLLSTFAQYCADGDGKAFKKLLLKAAIAILVLGIAIGTALAFAGEWLLVLLFGESITDHVYLLLPVIACTFVTALLWFLNDLLITVRKFTGSIAGNVIALIATIITTPFLVDAFSANGVSFVVIAAYTMGTLVMFGFVVHAMHTLFDETKS